MQCSLPHQARTMGTDRNSRGGAIAHAVVYRVTLAARLILHRLQSGEACRAVARQRDLAIEPQ